MAMGVAVFAGWPFCGILAIPIGLLLLHRKAQILQLVVVSCLTVILLIVRKGVHTGPHLTPVLPAASDVCGGQLLLRRGPVALAQHCDVQCPPQRRGLKRALRSRCVTLLSRQKGFMASLVEPWYFYFLNAALNFNCLLPLALLTPLVSSFA